MSEFVLSDLSHEIDSSAQDRILIRSAYLVHELSACATVACVAYQFHIHTHHTGCPPQAWEPLVVEDCTGQKGDLQWDVGLLDIL